VDLSFVQSGLLEKYLDTDVISAARVTALLERRGILDGTPVYLDEETQTPVPPLCEFGRYLSTALLDETTLKDYGRVIGRLDDHLADLGSDVLSAAESDLISYRSHRTQRQRRPVGASVWGRESFVLDDFYGFLIDRKILTHRPARLAARGRNALSPRVRSGMDIRHLTFEQYRYFRDVGLGGQLPTAQVDPAFRGWSPLRGRAGSDIALGSGARWREWATVLLPEIGLWPGMPGGPAAYTVQACAKYAKARPIYVPEDAVASAELFCLLERPDIVRRAARSLERKARDLFVVGEVDVADGRVKGVLDGVVREFQMSAMDAKLRRITVFEGEFGLEALTLFVCRGGLMPQADAWKSYRHRAWTRMTSLAGRSTPLLPARRWRWHDLRHTYALRLLTYLENIMDGMEPDLQARRRRHRSYLTGHIRHNPLLIVSRRLGHSSPETTYEYLQYTDDLINEFEAAFSGWVGDDEASYADIASHAMSDVKSGR
jgi:integrase